MQTFAEFLNNQNDSTASKLPTFADFLKTQPASQPTFFQKAAGLLKKGANAVYDIAGGLLLPGATPEELRNPTILKDTLLGLPKAVYDVTKQAITHPIETAQSAVGGATRGMSDVVTGILTNLFVPKEEQAATSQEIKNILDKYLGATPQNNISQGFEMAGQAAPYIAAGEIGGEVLGTAGTIVGFVGVGQASMPTDSTLKERAEQAAKDLIGLGLFSLGSKGFNLAKDHIFHAMKADISAKLEVKNETPEAQNVPVNVQKPEITAIPTTKEIFRGTPPPIEPTKEGITLIRPKTAQTLKPIIGTGEVKTRGLSQSLEETAIANDLSKGFGDLPEFKGADFKKISSDIIKHIANSPDEAFAIAMGDKAAPKGSIPEMYLNILVKDAVARGDSLLIKRLATESKLVGGATTMGQRLAALGYQKDPIDPVGLIKEIQNARDTALKQRNIDLKKEQALTESTFKDTIKKTRSSASAWAKLVQEVISCK